MSGEKIDFKEAMEILMPALQNAMHKGKGYTREELLSSGQFERIVSECLEDLEPVIHQQEENPSKEKIQKVIQNTLEDPSHLEDTQELLTKILNLASS